MARVIRASSAPRVVPAEVHDARTEAARIVERARADAAEILRAAREERELLRAEARAAAAEDARTEVAALLVAAERARDAAVERAARDVRTLALVAAERLVGEALTIEPERIVRVVRDAMLRARRARSIELRVHPDDVPAIEAARLPVTIVADATVTRGGCLVRTELGTIDARLEVRLEALARALDCEPPGRS